MRTGPSLTVSNHDRDVAGMTYVYPVLSRRAGGVSVGINLNPNRACNWRCVYCQVPGLVRGPGPEIELERLERELVDLLDAIRGGEPPASTLGIAQAALRDVAFSGNGEPTLSPSFPAAVEVVGRVLESRGILGSLPLVLISNGSTFRKPPVAAALARLSAFAGELWFKLDRVTQAGMVQVNGVRLSWQERLQALRIAVERAPTWLQTCVFRWEGAPPSAEEQDAYLDRLRQLKTEGLPLRGVLLYTIARPSAQPESDRVTPLPRAWLEEFGRRIDETGFAVRVSA